jgi:hypothetical protein
MSPKQQLLALLREALVNTPCDCPACTPDHPSHSMCVAMFHGCRKMQRRIEVENQFRQQLGLSPTDTIPDS